MAWEKTGIEGTIGILHTGILHTAWALAFKRLIHGPVKFSLISGLPYDVARNKVVESFLDGGGEYLFFLDSDVVVSSSCLIELQQISKHHNLPIVAALYWRRAPPTHPAMWTEHPDKPGHYEPVLPYICKTCGDKLVNSHAAKIHADVNGHNVIRNWDKDDVLKVDVVHMGATLIKREVFEKLIESNKRKPFFYYNLEKTKKYRPGYSEDFYFCNRVRRELGIRPAIATGVVAHHISNTYIDGETGEIKFIEI